MLHFFQCWLAIIIFPHLDLGIIRTIDLRLPFTMVHEIRVSPVKALVAYWHNVVGSSGPIEFTSMVTRIDGIQSLLDGAFLSQSIPTARGMVTKDYFIHDHMLKRGPRGTLVMVYGNHTAELPLTCERRQLYWVCQLMFVKDRAR